VTLEHGADVEEGHDLRLVDHDVRGRVAGDDGAEQAIDAGHEDLRGDRLPRRV